jgi:aspartyl-tRNA(Asn)/glutamyl-tRNA(Gln) amidotransferase subunit B
MEYRPTIGIEVHAELKTATKVFCSCKNDPDEKKPNINICEVCLAHPGTLPVLNKEAVKHILRVGAAIGGQLADFTEFDRKNYFYPDLPKGYQISQYKYPLVLGGTLNGVAITRIHLEEDTARSSHDKGGETLVDFNRAGLPLMELVTEPVIDSAKEAGDFARELQLLLRTLGVSEANMEKGEMRVEANISVSKDANSFGTKVEVKNLNSFRVVEKAVAYEIERQIKLLDEGGKVVQETRGWDEKGEKTFSQRVKESSHDYRYFPDPDVPKLKISEVLEFQNLKETLPELPWEKRARYQSLGLKGEDIETYVRDSVFDTFFKEVVDLLNKDLKLVILASNYITSDLVSYKDFGKLKAQDFARLIHMTGDGLISSRGAKEILAILVREGGDPETIAKNHNLLQKSDEEDLKTIVEKVIRENEKVVLEYKNGKDGVLQFLVGQGMKASGGSANPGVLADIFKKELKK